MLKLKRTLALLLTPAMLFMFFVGCAPEETTDAPDGATSSATTSQADGAEEAREFVLFTSIKSEPQTAAFQTYILDAFMEQNPDIKIDWQPTADNDETLRIQMASGEGPDLMDLNGPTDALEYYNSEQLIDLAPYAEENGWYDTFYDWSLSVCTTADGELTGVPTAYEGMVMYYNKTMFEENGWDYPKTYSEFIAICEAAAAQDIIPVAFGTSGFNRINEWWISSFLSSYASRDEMDQLLTGGLTFNDPEIKGAFDLFEENWENGYISKSDSVAVSYEDARSLFTQGRAAFIMEGTWYQQTLEGGDMDYGVELLPSFKDDKDQVFPVAVSRIMAINADTPYVDDIVEFLDFLVTDEEGYAKSITEGNNQPMPINVDISQYTSEMPEKTAYMLNLTIDSQNTGNTGYCLWTFFPQNTRLYLYETLDGVLLDQLTMDEYLTEAQAILDTDIAEGNVPRVE